jgi:hypothetical protein
MQWEAQWTAVHRVSADLKRILYITTQYNTRNNTIHHSTTHHRTVCYIASHHITSQYSTAHSAYFFLLVQAIVNDEVVHASLLVIVIVPSIGTGWDGA